MSLSSHDILSAAGIVFASLSYGVYIRGIIRGDVRPHFFTWFIWALLMAIGFFAQYAEKAGPGMWVTAFSVAATAAIAAFAVKKGERHITRSDWAFFIAALAAIPAWLMTDTPLYAVIMISIIDVLGFCPTYRKSWMKPWDESATTYLFGALQFLCSMMAMSTFNITTTLYPLTIAGSNVALLVLLRVRRRVLKSSQ